MDIRGMYGEYFVFDLAGEKIHHHIYPPINNIKAPILRRNGVSNNESSDNSVNGGSCRYVLSNGFIVVIDCEYGIPESQNIITCHISTSADTERKQLPFLWIFLSKIVLLPLGCSIFVIVASNGGFKEAL